MWEEVVSYVRRIFRRVISKEDSIVDKTMD